MPMYDVTNSRPPSERELAHKELQDHYKEFFKRETLLEDLSELEQQYAVKVQQFYATTHESPAQREAAQAELDEEKRLLVQTRTLIEQLMRAAEGKAY